MARLSLGVKRVTVEANNGVVQEFTAPDLIGVSVMLAGVPSIANPGLFPDQCVSQSHNEPTTTVLSTIPPRSEPSKPPVPVLYEWDFVGLLREHEDDRDGLADAIAAVFGYSGVDAALEAWPGGEGDEWDEDWNWDYVEDEDDDE